MRFQKFISIGLWPAALALAAGCATSPRPAELPITQRQPYTDERNRNVDREEIARVVELRGEEGELARISLGIENGAAAGKTVEFFVFADYSDLVPGARNEPSPIGYGVITEAEEGLSWVKITDPEREVVRRGHYARIAPKQPETPVEKVKGLFTGKGKSEEDAAREP